MKDQTCWCVYHGLSIFVDEYVSDCNKLWLTFASKYLVHLLHIKYLW